MQKTSRFETTSMSLHIMAMVFMLCDHLWGTIIPGNDWLTCIGRLTYPIYLPPGIRSLGTLMVSACSGGCPSWQIFC